MSSTTHCLDPGDYNPLPAQGRLYTTKRTAGASNSASYHEVKGERVLLHGPARIRYAPAYRATSAQRDVRAQKSAHADNLGAANLAGLGTLRRILRDVTFTIHDPATQEDATPGPHVSVSWLLPGGRLLPCAKLRLEDLRDLTRAAAP